MLWFQNDYSEGAHPKVLQALLDTNLTQTVGYGLDPGILNPYGEAHDDWELRVADLEDEIEDLESRRET